VRTDSDNHSGQKGRRLNDLRSKTAELERELDDVRMLLKCELARGYDEIDIRDIRERIGSPDARTETLVIQGRPGAYRRRLSDRTKLAIGIVLVAAFVAVLVIVMSSGGASWPASVAVVQNEITKACQNPDVKSEPGQVDFACAQSTSQILWVFSLLTSGDNAEFNDTQSGRLGLEPIAPTQGGQIALSLNLHNPYNPYNPIDSLEVAARAINSIIGGATVTGSDGQAVVQAGLEGEAANCLRYTGSAAMTSRAGFPSVCAKPVVTSAGQAALVADVYQKWMVGATPSQAQDAALLFQNSNNPGNPQVQQILRHVPSSTPTA
jgi:hypothetical protein